MEVVASRPGAVVVARQDGVGAGGVEEAGTDLRVFLGIPIGAEEGAIGAVDLHARHECIRRVHHSGDDLLAGCARHHEVEDDTPALG